MWFDKHQCLKQQKWKIFVWNELWKLQIKIIRLILKNKRLNLGLKQSIRIMLIFYIKIPLFIFWLCSLIEFIHFEHNICWKDCYLIQMITCWNCNIRFKKKDDYFSKLSWLLLAIKLLNVVYQIKTNKCKKCSNINCYEIFDNIITNQWLL